MKKTPFVVMLICFACAGARPTASEEGELRTRFRMSAAQWKACSANAVDLADAESSGSPLEQEHRRLSLETCLGLFAEPAPASAPAPAHPDSRYGNGAVPIVPALEPSAETVPDAEPSDPPPAPLQSAEEEAQLAREAREEREDARRAKREAKRTARRQAAYFKSFFPLGLPLDDGYLEREFHDNPARLDDWMRRQTKRLVIVGRVTDITHPGARGYLIRLAPRRSSFTLECETRSGPQLASLHRGGLAIVSGMATALSGETLRVRQCRVEYAFQDGPKVIGASYGICLGEMSKATCAFGPAPEGCLDAWAKVKASMKAARAFVGAKAIRCSSPIIALLRLCELGEDDDGRKFVQLSCFGRHEIVDARNEIISDEEGHTERDLAGPFQVEREPRSRLLDQMIKSGQIQDEDR